MTNEREHSDSRIGRTNGTRRRQFLASAAAASTAGLAGCFGMLGGDDNGEALEFSISDFRGSGPLVSERPEPGGTSIADLPDLEGELVFYLGGGESGLYLDLIDLFGQIYPDFEYESSRGSSSQLSNQITEEVDAGASPADLFLAVDAGALGNVAQSDAAQSLSSETTDLVPAALQAEGWIGFAGRARAVPYNTNQLSASDIPDTVQDFPGTAALDGSMGWAPTYGAFQSFITAMRLIRGESETRAWLNDMVSAGVEEFNNEFLISNEVANGALNAGFANHYYALRVRSQRQNAPIELAFTSGDAGALINVSGAQIIEGASSPELAENFIRHLLSAEAQEFFATRTFAYPTIPGVDPVGGLPTIDELNPPEIDLAELADTQPTLELLNETGIL
ncbi:extracellular solute-binding protein [Halovenus sp. WSH3]|uniref:Extracellular solute-binding protein n=1 Tax=Halovenus carboxidivorans TaxID=2692199 RepID=A0A6B0T598_9EURY|nr:extracellular solute-binding protein [Halovenus carboxidivorans]MXR50492.1 extracellular solute-binding protein [Halovenus carboxidivorans]